MTHKWYASETVRKPRHLTKTIIIMFTFACPIAVNHTANLSNTQRATAAITREYAHHVILDSTRRSRFCCCCSLANQDVMSLAPTWEAIRPMSVCLEAFATCCGLFHQPLIPCLFSPSDPSFEGRHLRPLSQRAGQS